jgi:hypothetical protein
VIVARLPCRQPSHSKSSWFKASTWSCVSGESDDTFLLLCLSTQNARDLCLLLRNTRQSPCFCLYCHSSRRCAYQVSKYSLPRATLAGRSTYEDTEMNKWPLKHEPLTALPQPQSLAEVAPIEPTPPRRTLSSVPACTRSCRHCTRQLTEQPGVASWSWVNWTRCWKPAIPCAQGSVCHSTQNRSGSEHPLDPAKVERLLSLFSFSVYEPNPQVPYYWCAARDSYHILVCIATIHVGADTKRTNHF